jgi:hypothetical protein
MIIIVFEANDIIYFFLCVWFFYLLIGCSGLLFVEYVLCLIDNNKK